MKHLAINTAIEPYSIGLFDEDKFFAASLWSFSESKKNIHFKLLESLLKNTNIIEDQIDFVTVVGGPGSFTGLRIGFTVAKTVGFIKNIPLVIPSTFEILKRKVKLDGLFVINAGLGEVFVSDGKETKILKITELSKIDKILIFPERSLFLKVGRGINIEISINEVGKLGFYKYNKGETTDYKKAFPYYMRDTKSIFKPYKEE